MRHLQRMQLGMALAAVLLCFTTTATTVHATHDTNLSSADAQTLSSALHLDESSEGTVEVFRNIEQDRLPVAVIHPTDVLYDRFMRSIYNARRTHSTHAKPSYFIVMYSKTGQAVCILDVRTDGQLHDDKTGQSFQAGRVFDDLLKVVTDNRIH